MQTQSLPLHEGIWGGRRDLDVRGLFLARGIRHTSKSSQAVAA